MRVRHRTPRKLRAKRPAAPHEELEGERAWGLPMLLRRRRQVLKEPSSIPRRAQDVQAQHTSEMQFARDCAICYKR